MKLEQLKQEITQLSALVEGWQESGCAVEIERDLALEKVRKIYNTLRFEVEFTPQQEVAEGLAKSVSGVTASILASAAMEASQQESETESEPDFEIEFIMPEVGEDDESSVTDTEDEELYEDEVDEEEEFDNEYTDEDDEEGDYNDGEEEEEPAVEPQAEPEIEVEPVVEPAHTPIPTPTPAPQSQPEPAQQPAQQPQFGLEQSLFGAEPAPRTTPRRRSLLMSLYDDVPQAESAHSESQPTQAAAPAKSVAGPHTNTLARPNAAHQTAPNASTTKSVETPKPAPRTVIHVQEPTVVTLADTDVEAVLGEVLMPERQTLGDTISPTQTVAESAPVKSLRSVISVADRFMLSRSLFGGDDTAFDRAIEELDSFDDFDNCIIHITENYSWPPASEGAKMIIELLQRKFL